MKTERLKKNKIIYISVICLILGLICLVLSGCAEIRLAAFGKKDSLIEIGDSSCSKQEALFMLLEEKTLYENGQDPENLWKRPIGEEDMSSYVKDIVAERLIRYTAAEEMSDGLAVYLTEDEKAIAGEAAVAAWAKISVLYDMDHMGIKAEDAGDLYYKMALYQAVYNKITTEATAGITEDSTRVMEADYVIVPKSAGEDTAYAILNSIREGKEFSIACSEAGYPLYPAQIIRRGELPNSVDTVAFALNDGEFSEVVEYKDGYYILFCIDDNLINESAANYNEIMTNTKETAFKEAFDEFSKSSKMVFDSSYWNKINIGSLQ